MEEFFVALKLMALAQANMTVAIAELGAETALPLVGSVAAAAPVTAPASSEAGPAEQNPTEQNRTKPGMTKEGGQSQKKEGGKASGWAPEIRPKHRKSLPNGRQQGGAFGAAPLGFLLSSIW